MRTQSFIKANIARIALAAWYVAFTTSSAAAANSLSDGQIIGIYIQVNSFDLETALLGRAQATSESVRDVAKHVASDHLGVRQAAYALAEQCKVAIELPEGRAAAAVEQDKALKKLLAMSGRSFDQAYVQQEVAFHRSAIDAVRTRLLPAATCPALKAHFNSVLPAFEHHLTMMEGVQRDAGAR